MLARAAYTANFLFAASIGVVFVFLADLQDRYGLTNWEFGVLASIGFVAALLTQLAFSPLIDRGFVRAPAWASVALGSIGIVGFAFADGFLTLTVSRAMVGVGLGLFAATARKAILGLDMVGGGKKVGTLLSTGVGGFILGPVIGTALGRIAFGAPFIVLGIALAVVGAWAARLISEAPIAASPVEYGDIGALLRRPRVQAAITGQIVIWIAIGVFDSIFDRYLTDLGIGDFAIATVILIIGAPMLVLPRIAGDMAEQHGAARTVLPGLLLLVPALFFYGFVGGAVAVALLGMAHGSGEAFAAISGQMLVLEETGTERASVGSAILDTAGMITATIAAFLAPPIYGQWGATALFVGAGLLALALTAVTAQRLRAIKREPVDTITAPVAPATTFR